MGAGGGTVVLQLLVSDGVLTSDASEVSIIVQNINDPPACDAARPSRPLRLGVLPNMKPGTVAIDDGQLYDATRP